MVGRNEWTESGSSQRSAVVCETCGKLKPSRAAAFWQRSGDGTSPLYIINTIRWHPIWDECTWNMHWWKNTETDKVSFQHSWLVHGEFHCITSAVTDAEFPQKGAAFCWPSAHSVFFVIHLLLCNLDKSFYHSYLVQCDSEVPLGSKFNHLFA